MSAAASPGLMSAVEMAKWLGVRLVWLERQAKDRFIPSMQLDGARRFDPVAVMAALQRLAGVDPVGRPYKSVELMSVSVFSGKTRIPKPQVVAMVKAGELPSFTVGQFTYVNADVCFALLDSLAADGRPDKFAKEWLGYIPAAKEGEAANG